MNIKNRKDTRKCVIKRKLKFQVYKNCLEVAQTENEIYHVEKNKTDVDSLQEGQKEFIKNNELILKTQQRFRNETHNVFTEKIVLSSNDDKRMQSIDSTETYAYGMNKDVVCKKEEIKSNNKTKQKCLIWLHYKRRDKRT